MIYPRNVCLSLFARVTLYHHQHPATSEWTSAKDPQNQLSRALCVLLAVRSRTQTPPPPRILAVNAGLYNDAEVFDGYEDWEVSNLNGRCERGARDFRAPGTYMKLFVH